MKFIYKPEENATRVQIKGVRISYPHLFARQVKVDDNGVEKVGSYGAQFMFPKEGSEDAVAALKAAMKAAANKKWGSETGPKLLSGLAKQDRLFLHDGDNKVDDQGDTPPEYVGMWYFSANAYTTKPSVFDNRRVGGRPVELSENDGRIYAGCYVNVIFDVWAQDKKGEAGKRINAGLSGVQFAADGEPLAGGKAASGDEFDFEEEEADAAGEDEEFDFLK